MEGDIAKFLHIPISAICALQRDHVLQVLPQDTLAKGPLGSALPLRSPGRSGPCPLTAKIFNIIIIVLLSSSFCLIIEFLFILMYNMVTCYCSLKIFSQLPWQNFPSCGSGFWARKDFSTVSNSSVRASLHLSDGSTLKTVSLGLSIYMFKKIK